MLMNWNSLGLGGIEKSRISLRDGVAFTVHKDV